jgi:Zn-dependent protease with chaperone function
MTVPFVLLILGALTAATAPRLLDRAAWTDREPVLALWVWSCVVAAVLLCCLAASAAVRWHVFAFAPRGVMEAYALNPYGSLSAALALLLAGGGARSATMLTREVRAGRALRRHQRAEVRSRAPYLPGEARAPRRLVVLESDRADAWWQPGPPPGLVVTTAALRRLNDRQLEAVRAHELGHARARHDWLCACAYALAAGFPGVPVFDGFRRQVHRLVELAADDVASRRFGRMTTALALVGLNEDRAVFGPCPAPWSPPPA